MRDVDFAIIDALAVPPLKLAIASMFVRSARLMLPLILTCASPSTVNTAKPFCTLLSLASPTFNCDDVLNVPPAVCTTPVPPRLSPKLPP